MRQRDENYLSMVTVTLDVLDKYARVWQSNRPFTAAVQEVTDARAAVQSNLKGSMLVTEGATMDKEGAREKAITLAVKLTGYTRAYAADKHDNRLHEQMTVSYSSLDRAPDEELGPRLENLLDRMKAISDIADFGVTDLRLSELKAAIDTFNSMKAAPRSAIGERKSFNETIPGLLRAMRESFYKMDRLIPMWEDDEPFFVSEYRTARQVIDLGGGKKDTPEEDQ